MYCCHLRVIFECLSNQKHVSNNLAKDQSHVRHFVGCKLLKFVQKLWQKSGVVGLKNTNVEKMTEVSDSSIQKVQNETKA